MGYISGYIEEGYKTIIIANEEEILNKNEEYNKFKEKVIGKSLEVQHNFDSILGIFVQDIRHIEKCAIEAVKNAISKAYHRADYHNLRHIKQSIDNFNFIIKNIDSRYLKNIDFLSEFTFIFFAINIEIKNGNIDDEKLLEWEKIFLEKDSQHILRKYNLNIVPLLSIEIWSNILLKSVINIEEFNVAISKTRYFIDETQPTWARLWHYFSLEDKEFDILLEDVIKKFENNEYTTPNILLHIVTLLTYFENIGLSDYPLSNIKIYMKSGLENCYKKHNDRKYYLINDILMDNHTGLGYIGLENQAVQNIFEEFKTENTKLFEQDKENKQQINFDNFIESIDHNNFIFIEKFLLGDNDTIPVFKNKDSKLFVNTVVNISNDTRKKLGSFLKSRYSLHKYFNNRQFGEYLAEELRFWQDVKDELQNLNTTSMGKLKTLSLKNFEQYIVDENIKQMSCTV